MAIGVGIGIVLLVLALALAGVAVWLVAPLRTRVDRLAGDVNSLQAALDQLRAELAELRAATEVVSVPPLPKSRPPGLDDLRQRLRAAHTQPEEAPEE